MSHASNDELLKRIEKAREKVAVGKRYSHYKDVSKSYKVLDIVIDESSEKPLVIYQAEYGDNITFARSVESWCQKVSNGTLEIQRFTPLDVI